jgi:hypothetical protein
LSRTDQRFFSASGSITILGFLAFFTLLFLAFFAFLDFLAFAFLRFRLAFLLDLRSESDPEDDVFFSELEELALESGSEPSSEESSDGGSGR